MKKELTRKETEYLISLGVSKDLATTFPVTEFKNGKPIAVRRFTLADICGLLPKGVIHNGLSCKLRITSWYDEPYFAGYENQIGKYIMGNPYDAPFDAEELIDALFDLLLWAIGHGHIDLTK